MSQVRVYINTFDAASAYSGFQEVTDDVDIGTLTNISQRLDQDEYDIGVYKNTNFNLKLRNDHGLYSEPGVIQSIFVKKRINSLVKVTWAIADEFPICGIAICGQAALGSEQNIFYGLLNDIASSQNIDDQKITFSCQGLESIFDRLETNYSSLTASDNITDIMYDLLNQTEITDLMTVSAGNISVGVDQVPDSITDLEETTVKEALSRLMLMTNSVLYIDVTTQTLYIKPRTPAASVEYTFYGQAADTGIENIVNIKNIRTGLNKTFNFWKWTDTTTTAKDTTSITLNGVRKKELSDDLFTNTTKRQNILNDYKDDFKDAKRSLDITGILDYETLDLFLLDRITIIYPTVFEAAPGSTLPIYGVAIYGTDKYPLGKWNLTLDSTTEWKILGRKIDLKNDLITLEVKEI